MSAAVSKPYAEKFVTLKQGGKSGVHSNAPAGALPVAMGVAQESAAKLTPEQEARAMLLAAVDVCRANEARCVEEAEQLAEVAYEISIQSGDKVREATKWREAMIDFACQYGQRVDEQTDEECSCPRCSADGRP